jgi:hypothetical protein
MLMTHKSMKERGAFITLLEEIAFELLSKEHSLN